MELSVDVEALVFYAFSFFVHKFLNFKSLLLNAEHVDCIKGKGLFTNGTPQE